MINWKVRIKNKNFWLSIIPAIILLIQSIANVFGYTINFGTLSDNLIAVVNAVFVVLTILGVVTDHTTEGIGDSNRAMTYTEPYKDIVD
ncbi:MAG: phage holin [Treponema sp.]|nr:phage holin [Treponema sp.]